MSQVWNDLDKYLRVCVCVRVTVIERAYLVHRKP